MSTDEKEPLPDRYWHCGVAKGTGKGRQTAVVNNLTRDELFKQIVNPWHSDRKFAVSGLLLKPSDASEIRIAYTSEPLEAYMHRHDLEMRARGIVDMATDQRTLPLARGQDYTTDLLFSDAKGEDKVGHKTLVHEGGFVFIGHGRAKEWLALEKFLRDRLRLTCQEFNAVPTAGVATKERLQQMLDGATFAFIVMTAEDIAADGSERARENVVHEAGLFQGRLGFERAIILLEEGCSEFSNIHGIGQIRFPKGKIDACFEEVRRVLEREGLVKA